MPRPTQQDFERLLEFRVTLRRFWTAHDARSDVTKAEYSINGGDWTVVDPVSKLSDSPEEEYHLTIPRPSPGEQVVAVRVTDEFDNQAVEKVVVK